MSLNIYRTKEELRKNGIECEMSNDLFFNKNTFINNNDFVKTILRKIDKADYYSDTMFVGRTKDWGNINKNHLSTGTKTLLNILSYPEKCFSLEECGSNALDFVPKIKEGNVLWECIVLFPEDDDESCDIKYKGKKYTNIYDFLDDVRRDDEG